MFVLATEHTKPYVTDVARIRTKKGATRKASAASEPSTREEAESAAEKTERTRKRVPERTRAGLLEAAAELFLEQGLDGPSLDAICERAGYTRGAFYVHFATRDELVGAVVEKTMSELLDAIAPEDDELSLETVVERFIAALLEGRLPVSRHIRASQVLEACSRSWDLRVKYLAILVRARQRLTEVIRRSLATGAVRDDVDAPALADMLLAVVLGVQVAQQLGAPYDARAVQAELLRSLAPRSAARTTTKRAATKKKRSARR